MTDALDVEEIRADFPILQRRVGEWPLVYLDSANTSQKPRQVVDAIAEHYLQHNANVARAMHLLGAEATEAFEGARAKVAAFIGAARPEEIVFTKNASEALNLAAHTLGQYLGWAGRRGRHLRDGAPLQHRAVAAAVPAHRRHAALVRRHRRGPPRPRGRRTRRAHQRAHEGRLADVGVQRARHRQPDRRRSRPRPTRSARSWWWTPRRASRTRPTDVAALGADLVAFTGHKMFGPDRHRRPLGPLRPARRRCRPSWAAAR